MWYYLRKKYGGALDCMSKIQKEDCPTVEEGIFIRPEQKLSKTEEVVAHSGVR
ncbi:MAG: hypothetical protein NPIRA04_21890 [Nitrospirales bacterium]|nr:MAG: hypothetical protein NPIRA04_21890 [Nitrospirales bacterium]